MHGRRRAVYRLLVTYDPFARGTYPVGVRTIEVYDAERDRMLPTEVWYPATSAYVGQDLADATKDVYEPLANLPPSFQNAVRDADEADGGIPIAFSHGVAGHRRQSTHLCTHLASHGYVVAAPDHVGNTLADLMHQFLSGPSGADLLELFIQSGLDRPIDILRVLDAVGGEEPVGVCGHSFGGWTTLAVADQDERIAAALPLAPGGGDAGTIEGVDLRDTLDLAWDRDIPTLILAAELDSLIPVAGVKDLFSRLASARGLAVLGAADHWHFCDNVEEVHDLMVGLSTGLGVSGIVPSSELCPGEAAGSFTTGLATAHFDAHLKRSTEAAAFLERDLVSEFSERGINIDFTRP